MHGDTLVLDRWLWLKKRLPLTLNGEKLLDIGCGSGAFTMGAARRGYECLGLSWDQRNQSIAAERAGMLNIRSAQFEICDVRHLHTKTELHGQFEVAICFENAEHILDDNKLIRDIAACLCPGGRLYLTVPYHYYRAITSSDNGPFPRTESGWHVRRGYTKGMLLELCQGAGIVCEDISYCSGFLSQKITAALRAFTRISPRFAWAATFPFRLFPPLLDPAISRFSGWPNYSICMEAYKPRRIVSTRLAPMEVSGSK